MGVRPQYFQYFETISKIVAKADNEVTYQDMMIAAGHLARTEVDENREVVIERESPMNIRHRMNELEKRFIQIILADLYENPLNWSVEKQEGRFTQPDMVLNIDYAEYNKWYFEFVPVNSERRRFSTLNFIHLYGRITMYELSETDKFTIVINSEELFNRILKRPPLSLRTNLYVMLIDLEGGKIIKEEKLCSYMKQ